MARPRTSPGDIAGVFFALALFAAMFASTTSHSAASPVSAPVIDILMASRTSVFNMQSTELYCVAHQDDGSPLTYFWTCSGGAVVPSGDSALWFAPDSPGAYPIVVEVNNDMGGFAVAAVFVTVVQNQPPEIVSLTAEPDEVQPGGSAVLTCEVHDPEGQALTYEWLGPSGDIAGSGPTVTWIAPYRSGEHVTALRVTDELGASSTKNLTLYVACPVPPVVDKLVVWPTMPDYTKVDIHGDYRLLHGKYTKCEIECDAIGQEGQLTYEWSCTEGSIEGTGDLVIFTPPHKTTDVHVTVRVSDTCGQTADSELLFHVYMGDDYPTAVDFLPGCMRCLRGY